MKKLIIAILTILLLAVIAYFIFLNLPKASSKNKEAKVSVTAIDLYNVFSTNEKKANRDYLGQTIEISGSISEIDEDRQGAKVLFLETSDPMNTVLCTLELGEKSNLKVGDNVKVKGLCSGFLRDVVINKCVIVQ